jgi:hypothetical protein
MTAVLDPRHHSSQDTCERHQQKSVYERGCNIERPALHLAYGIGIVIGIGEQGTSAPGALRFSAALGLSSVAWPVFIGALSHAKVGKFQKRLPALGVLAMSAHYVRLRRCLPSSPVGTFGCLAWHSTRREAACCSLRATAHD